jgi:polysaccharide export outer membrane protein
MRGVRAAIICLFAALALPGGMRTATPVAAVQPQSDLDANDGSGSSRFVVPLGTARSPADTILVGERWF